MRRTVLQSKIQAQDIALKNTKRLHSYFPSLLQPSVRKKQKKKKKAPPVLLKRSHQTYIHVLPNRQKLLSLIPEKVLLLSFLVNYNLKSHGNNLWIFDKNL